MNFEKDYLGVNNLPDKNKNEPTIIESDKLRPNLDVLKEQRDKYIDIAIEKCNENIKKIYSERGKDANERINKLIFDQLVNDHGIKLTQVKAEENEGSLRELKGIYDNESIQKRLNKYF